MASGATLATLALLVGASPAGAVVVGAPTYSPGAGWSCTPTAAGTEKLAGGATYTCSGTAGVFSNLYIGIKNNNVPAGTVPIGEEMNGTGATQPSGAEIFVHSSTGATTIVYTGSTSISSGGPATVFLRHTLTFTGTGTMVTDATTIALSNANGAVHSLWRIGPAVTSMTVNSLIEASTSAGGPWTPARTFFGTTTTHRLGTGSTEVDKSHVDIAFYASICGDAVTDPDSSEQCDNGPSNGTGGQCCNGNCTVVTAGIPCRLSAGACDLGETCNGTSGTCPADAFRPSTFQCRSSTGECDPDETCTGSGPNCPADAKSPAGTGCSTDGNPCTLDQCDGTSAACQHPAGNAGALCRTGSGDVCDPDETCTGVTTSCPADVILPPTFFCRPGVDECDESEGCGGVPGQPCPPDQKKPAGSLCTSDGNPCSLDECNGVSDACQHPAGNAGAECRASAGVCDPAETCDGTSTACPADALEPSTTVCRSAAGECDVAESCTGSGTDCPADAKAPAATSCTDEGNPCSLDQCDGTNDACQHPAGNAGAECRAVAGACDVAETCDGTSTDCPADGFQPSTLVCRSSAGDCDVAESCTGSSAACPADAFQPSTTVCRAATDVCDAAENCTGLGATCPVDGLQPSGTVCRTAAGACDVADTCDGASPACPADAKSTAECRASAGVCDVAENCDGVSDTCPADALAPSTTVCRSATGVCDVAETCTGSSATCPADATVPDGTACNDGSACTGPDQCTGGVCSGQPNADTCADDFLCYKTKVPSMLPLTVSLADQFESATATVKKLKLLCTPADKNGEGVFDTTTHEVAYSIKSSLKHVRNTNVLVENQIGIDGTGATGIRVDTLKADLLFVPSNKDLTVDPPAPILSLINVDHYKCYKVKVTPGTPKLLKGLTVSVEDQFNSPAKVFVLKKPKHLCVPVDKNGEGIKNPDAHQLCYVVKGLTGQPKHVKRLGVHINNQFGVSVLNTTKESELCIPSIKTLTP